MHPTVFKFSFVKYFENQKNFSSLLLNCVLLSVGLYRIPMKHMGVYSYTVTECGKGLESIVNAIHRYLNFLLEV